MGVAGEQSNRDRNTREEQEEKPKRYLKPAFLRRYVVHAVVVLQPLAAVSPIACPAEPADEDRENDEEAPQREL